jgi:hypothetical protein
VTVSSSFATGKRAYHYGDLISYATAINTTNVGIFSTKIIEDIPILFVVLTVVT